MQCEIQDSQSVTAILRHVLECLHFIGIHEVEIRSDNAGAYKCTATLASIASIEEETDVRVLSYTFCEAQTGKGPCDRAAAFIKRTLRDYVDKGNDITSAKDFLNAVSDMNAPSTSNFAFITAS